MGPHEKVLVNQGWQQVGGGYWTNPEMDGGKDRFKLEEAIAKEYKRLVSCNYELKGILDKVSDALGLTCQYSELPASVERLVEARQVVRVSDGKLDEETVERLQKHMDEAKRSGKREEPVSFIATGADCECEGCKKLHAEIKAVRRALGAYPDSNLESLAKLYRDVYTFRMARCDSGDCEMVEMYRRSNEELRSERDKWRETAEQYRGDLNKLADILIPEITTKGKGFTTESLLDAARKARDKSEPEKHYDEQAMEGLADVAMNEAVAERIKDRLSRIPLKRWCGQEIYQAVLVELATDKSESSADWAMRKLCESVEPQPTIEKRLEVLRHHSRLQEDSIKKLEATAKAQEESVQRALVRVHKNAHEINLIKTDLYPKEHPRRKAVDESEGGSG